MKVYPICEPWWGDEGPGFERGFKEDFPANISKKVKDSFWIATLVGYYKGLHTSVCFVNAAPLRGGLLGQEPRPVALCYRFYLLIGVWVCVYIHPM